MDIPRYFLRSSSTVWCQIFSHRDVERLLCQIYQYQPRDSFQTLRFALFSSIDSFALVSHSVNQTHRIVHGTLRHFR